MNDQLFTPIEMEGEALRVVDHRRGRHADFGGKGFFGRPQPPSYCHVLNEW